ncbi:hypothetical protein HZH66_001219 [Vespula vulgaris]|uniref:Uncharacterized protein n=1 Tax=Vespula vulgaris TaxID=7454 RepID=A0A834NLM0_VESVU|nr:hypothetical protein HZH66_001219 [Vespula vulgaris]
MSRPPGCAPKLLRGSESTFPCVTSPPPPPSPPPSTSPPSSLSLPRTITTTTTTTTQQQQQQHQHQHQHPPTSLPLAPLLSSNGDPVRVVALALLPGALKGKGVVHASGSQRGRLVYGTVVTRYLPLRLMSAALLAFPRAKGITDFTMYTPCHNTDTIDRFFFISYISSFYDILIETPEGSTKSMLYIATNVVLSDKVQTDVDTRNILRVAKILSSRRVG